NQLTLNVHLLLISFYRPEGKRTKIICEQKAFPSDQYALETQVRLHGLNPDEHIVEVGPRAGEHTIRTEDILAAIEREGDSLAVVMIGGVNYFTGQLFDMSTITKAAHAVGALAGFDLAHAAGNVKLQLHDWGVDFAAWCSYKYLNSGPGSVAGAFVHERHANTTRPRLAGWWGHDKATRFKMEKGFQPIAGAEGWQLSNAPVFSMAAHRASLAIFDEVGMDALNEKTTLLTGYLEFIIDELSTAHGHSLEIITPRVRAERGCQLSVVAHGRGRSLFDSLTKAGVIADWREPNVIRMAPVPLYNSFEDVWRFGAKLGEAMK
ncbi:MAG: kynureninase, partial [Bacteroidia bacterium]